MFLIYKKCLSFIFFLSLFFVIACSNDETKTAEKRTEVIKPEVSIPIFNADSAYSYVQKQVDFGPRVPNTPEHDSCAVWLEAFFKPLADEVIVQKARVKAWDGVYLGMQNVIASFNPEIKNRVALFAHWDTRPFADQDSKDQDKPFPGANDGGSGVGVLMEIARQLNNSEINLGVDIILLDTEDYGNSDIQDSYCLGSQYWGKNLHKSGYHAQYGILLDMVGGKGARFNREGISMHFAKSIVKKVWGVASKKGYRDYFIYNNSPYPNLTDDHLYINRLTKIPTIDIIEYDENTPKGFGYFWHTHDDNMDIIDRKTLKAVGQTVLSVLYLEAAGEI